MADGMSRRIPVEPQTRGAKVARWTGRGLALRLEPPINSQYVSIMGPVGSIERYRFGPFELQPDKRRLLKDGVTISLRPRTFDLLAVLVDRAGHLVTKDELLNRAWPKVVVEEAALAVQVSALRKVLGSDAITTVSGRRLPVHAAGDDGRRRSESRIEIEAQPAL